MTDTGIWDVGDVVPLTVNVKDADGNLADATTVVLTITLPDDTTATPSVTNASTGVYQVDYTPTQVGRYRVRWVATGTNAGVYQDAFETRDSAATMLVSLTAAKAHLNIETTTHDDELRHFIEAASRACEKTTGKRWMRQTVVATKSGGRSHLSLAAYPLSSVTSVTEDGTTLTASDYHVDLERGLLTRASGDYGVGTWSAGFDNIVVTYETGTATTPATIRQGVLEMTRHLWLTQRGAAGRRGADTADFLQAFSIPRRVRELWEPEGNAGGFA